MFSRTARYLVSFLLLLGTIVSITSAVPAADEAQQVLMLRKVFAAPVFEWPTIFGENKKLIDDSLFERVEKRIRWSLDNGQVEDAIRFAYAGDLAAQSVGRKTDYRLQMSQLFRKIGNVSMALDLVSNILITDPKNIEAKYYQASLLQDANKFEDAYPLYEELIKEGAKVADCYYRIGLIDLMRQDITKAQEHFQKAVKDNPKHEAARKELAKIDAVVANATFVPKTPAGDSGIPFGSLNGGSRPAPTDNTVEITNIMTNAETARSAANAGTEDSPARMKRAIELYRQAIKLDPKLAEARILLGTALYQEGELDEAIENLEIAVGLAPLDANAMRYLAYCYERRYDTGNKKGDLDKATTLFERSQKLNPSNAFIGYDLKRINEKKAGLR